MKYHVSACMHIRIGADLSADSETEAKEILVAEVRKADVKHILQYVEGASIGDVTCFVVEDSPEKVQ